MINLLNLLFQCLYFLTLTSISDVETSEADDGFRLFLGDLLGVENPLNALSVVLSKSDILIKFSTMQFVNETQFVICPEPFVLSSYLIFNFQLSCEN